MLMTDPYAALEGCECNIGYGREISLFDHMDGFLRQNKHQTGQVGSTGGWSFVSDNLHSVRSKYQPQHFHPIHTKRQHC